jgi:hypothetical protein
MIYPVSKFMRFLKGRKFRKSYGEVLIYYQVTPLIPKGDLVLLTNMLHR